MGVTDPRLPALFHAMIVAYFFLAPSLVLSQLCYDPNGAVLHGFGICNNASSASLCCSVYSVCMSNGLCLNSLSGNFNRGGCTDESFSDPVCPNFCVTVPYQQVSPCNTTTTPFCCDSQSTGRCCQDPKSLLTIDPPVSSATAGLPTTAETAAPSSTSASRTSSNSNSTTPTSSASSSSPVVSHSGISVQIGVGVGVGVGGLAAILALTFLWYRRRKRTQSAVEKEDDIPELPPLLSSDRLNSKLFPAELDPDGEGLKGPAELDPKPPMPSRGPAELAISAAELPAEPVESEDDEEEESTQTNAAGSPAPSTRKSKRRFSFTGSTERAALTLPVPTHTQEHPVPVRSTGTSTQLPYLHPPSQFQGFSSTDLAESLPSSQSPQVPTPPPPSLATVPSTANTTPQPSPPRGHFVRHGKGVALEHPNKPDWSLEEEQARISSLDEGLEALQRPQTITERQKMGSLDLNSASGPWHDVYDANVGKTQPRDVGPGN